ncbi:aerobactin siderophore biosynthesis protein [Escherichia coli]|uniref:Aerobactin siderophore biosynthesis protein n=1 Tax=Escherichia coli TaxID=562 RepID=A0A376MNT0_ECOLX|nr:aerobactin siderophore biosynthesis protein [Escherichia coli]
MILPSEKSATDVAAQCFLNALIRETKDWQLAEYPPDELIIPLDEQKSLHFRVAYFSPTQHHRFAFLLIWSRHQAVILSILPLSPGLLLTSSGINFFCQFPSAKLSTNACWKATPIRNRQ